MNRPQANNNPFAIKQLPADSWRGLVKTASDGFLTFDNPRDGVRAGFINLSNAYIKRGLDTLNKIFPVYAPSSDGNNPSAYIATVSRLAGIAPNDRIRSQDQIYRIGKAITTNEEGNFWVKPEDFDGGFQDAMKASSILSTMVKGTFPVAIAVGLGLLLWMLVK